MIVVRSGSTVIVHAPAKLNLHLEVLARRSDGFHELETLMTAIDLVDTLQLTATLAEHITLNCRWAYGHAARSCGATLGDLPAPDENIVVRAVKRLRERAGIAQGANIELIKRIPSAAGLGGASSDAAAALVAANEAWQLGWSRERLAEVAAEIGSDVPFFLYTGTAGSGAAICRGRGERIEPVFGLARQNYVVAKPPEGLSTPLVFRHCKPAGTLEPIEPLVAAAREGNVPQVGRKLMNRLEEPAESLCLAIEQLRGELNRMGSLGSRLTGSGSSCFGLFRHRRQARRAARQLRARELGIVAVVATAAAPRRRATRSGS